MNLIIFSDEAKKKIPSFLTRLRLSELTFFKYFFYCDDEKTALFLLTILIIFSDKNPKQLFFLMKIQESKIQKSALNNNNTGNNNTDFVFVL